MNVCSPLLRFASALLATAAVTSAQAPSGFAELHAWYSPSRGDNFATTDPSWQGGPGQRRSPDYDFVRVEGYAFDRSGSQPPRTQTLHGWYSPSRGDNFATTDPSWRGAPGQRRSPDYVYVRNEGYVFDPALPQPPGTVALHSWYSPSRGDNFVSTDPTWQGGPGQRRAPDYVFVRVEGYVYEPGSLIPFAPGCGRGGGPQLWSSRGARAGQSFHVGMSIASGTIGSGLLLLDVQPTTRPGIDLGVVGMPGCLLRVLPLVSIPFQPTRSPTELGCQFFMPSASGVNIYAQGVLFDPGANPAGVVLSNASAARIQ